MIPGGIATRHSPSFLLVKAHLGAGFAGMGLFALALAWVGARVAGVGGAPVGGHWFQPTLLGLVHLGVLGWFLPVALGAMHQLLPVVFEVPVRSERLAWAGLALYVPGAGGLVVHLWGFHTGPGLAASATLLWCAVLVYVVNLVATLRAAHSVPLVGWYVVSALGWLVFAATLGLALAWNLTVPFIPGDHLQGLRAHAHVAALGFFGLLVMGVGMRLMEMFLVAFVKDATPARVALVAVNGALTALAGGRLLPWPHTGAAVLEVLTVALAATGIAAFLLQVSRLWRARLRKRVEVAWWHAFASFGYLALVAVLGGALALVPEGAVDAGVAARLEIAYGFLALVGFVGSIVVGQLYKIWPFLVWFHRFSPLAGLKKLPAASELLPAGRQRAQWIVFHAGVLLFAAGLVGRPGGALPPLAFAGGALFAVAAALFCAHMWTIARSRP